jgi:hypothetical protein
MANENITYSRFTALKSRLDAELKRRKYRGAVNTINNKYTVTPAAGKPIEQEHYNKINGPMTVINSSYNQGNKGNGDAIPSLDTLDANLSVLESTSATKSGGGCSGSCTGLCSSGC